MSATVLIALGGNLGDVEKTFLRAVAHLSSDLFDVRMSPVYRTAPHFDKPGCRAQDVPMYLNAVMVGQTYWPPDALLERLQAVERANGRRRGELCAPRSLDLDLLLYGDVILDAPASPLPHPRMHLRNFVLRPAADVAPNILHPVLGQTIAQLLASCRDDMTCEKLTDL